MGPENGRGDSRHCATQKRLQVKSPLSVLVYTATVTLGQRGTYCQGYLGFARMYLELLELLLELLLQLLLEVLLLLLLS